MTNKLLVIIIILLVGLLGSILFSPNQKDSVEIKKGEDSVEIKKGVFFKEVPHLTNRYRRPNKIQWIDGILYPKGPYEYRDPAHDNLHLYTKDTIELFIFRNTRVSEASAECSFRTFEEIAFFSIGGY